MPILLENPDCEVRLLIRAGSPDDLGRRVGELLRYWGWDAEDPRARRVRGLRGDAAQTRFGLDEGEWQALTDSCTHVLHSAGTVKMNLELEDARRSAVGSAREILGLARQLAERGRLAKVDFVSTVGVAGKRAGTLPEDWLESMPAFHNTYEQAKAEAEVLVERAVRDERLPITVHRPSMVIGDSRDGRVIHFQIFYFICEFLSGRRTMGLYPDFANVCLDIIPSDTVAGAIVAASRDPATAGRIFHLSSGPGLAPRIEEVKAEVRKAFARHGLDVPRAINLSMRWYARLARLAANLAPAQQRKALTTLPIYLDYLADRQAFGNDRFVAWFAERGGGIPHWPDYLPRVLDRYLQERKAR